MSWNPVTHPFRVSRTSQGKLYGWRHGGVMTFETLEQARAEFAKPKTRGVLKVHLDQAVNPETWMKNGKWLQLEAK